jgi:hypothetical protein
MNMKHYPISEPPQIAWDGRHADLHFLAPDGTAVIVSMPTKILLHLQERIAHKLAGRPGVRTPQMNTAEG